MLRHPQRSYVDKCVLPTNQRSKKNETRNKSSPTLGVIQGIQKRRGNVTYEGAIRDRRRKAIDRANLARLRRTPRRPHTPNRLHHIRHKRLPRGHGQRGHGEMDAAGVLKDVEVPTAGR